MNKSESIVKISQALLKAQKNIKSVTKEANNPFFKSKYADLASVINACKEELNAEGVTFLQPVNEMSVETILLHESGEWMSSETPIVCKSQNNPQDLGSAITYARRYALQSFIGLPAVDDDGEAATSHQDTSRTVIQRPNGSTIVEQVFKPLVPSTPENDVMAAFNLKNDSDIDQICPIHNCKVPRRVSKTGTGYWGCTADPIKMHFLDHPRKADSDQPLH